MISNKRGWIIHEMHVEGDRHNIYNSAGTCFSAPHLHLLSTYVSIAQCLEAHHKWWIYWVDESNPILLSNAEGYIKELSNE